MNTLEVMYVAWQGREARDSDPLACKGTGLEESEKSELISASPLSRPLCSPAGVPLSLFTGVHLLPTPSTQQSDW